MSQNESLGTVSDASVLYEGIRQIVRTSDALPAQHDTDTHQIELFGAQVVLARHIWLEHGLELPRRMYAGSYVAMIAVQAASGTKAPRSLAYTAAHGMENRSLVASRQPDGTVTCSTVVESGPSEFQILKPTDSEIAAALELTRALAFVAHVADGIAPNVEQ
jgi:hypothetical protein